MKKFADLAFTKIPSRGPHIHNLICLHGILGNQHNFRAFAKTPAFNTNTDVYLLDLRNHGDSEHLPTMQIPELSQDISNFMDRFD
jgi:pimeloyl-ACP methyl ester carboxylesterase